VRVALSGRHALWPTTLRADLTRPPIWASEADDVVRQVGSVDYFNPHGFTSKRVHPTRFAGLAARASGDGGLPSTRPRWHADWINGETPHAPGCARVAFPLCLDEMTDAGQATLLHTVAAPRRDQRSAPRE
jgi:hypothetical protein